MLSTRAGFAFTCGTVLETVCNCLYEFGIKYIYCSSVLSLDSCSLDSVAACKIVLPRNEACSVLAGTTQSCSCPCQSPGGSYVIVRDDCILEGLLEDNSRLFLKSC